jgi:Heterokaryon incompatibility protein (HET)
VPDYEAVSYTWGDPNNFSEINCNGQPLIVPKSAETVLRGLRLEDKTRVLWIDAICINQLDRREREEQVAIMGDVYKYAKRTLVWLGQDDDGFAETVDSMQDVLSEMREKTDGLKQLKSLIYSESGLVHNASQSQLGRQLGNLVKLYNHPWFSRLWVVQEVALSKECVCIFGRHEIPWIEVARTAVWMQYVIPQQHGTSRMDCAGIDNATVMWQYSEREYGLYGPGQARKLSLGNLLANSRHFKTSDARDKVYGLLALTTWSMSGRQLPPEITPDYRKSFMEVYRDATRLAIQEKQNLHILRYVLASEVEALNERRGFPSWVPRWDKRASACHARPLPKVFSAGQGRKMVLLHGSDPNCLELHGSLFDQVTKVSDIIDDICLRNDGVNRLVSSLYDLTQRPGTYPTGESVLEAITLTLIAHTINKHVVDKNVLCTQATALDPTIITTLIGSEDLKAQYTDARLEACLNRRFFITDRGYFGLGPQNMQRNDVVSVLFGGRTPYVLRPWGASHLFLGECYVHGIMFSEGIEEHAVPETRVCFFELR